MGALREKQHQAVALVLLAKAGTEGSVGPSIELAAAAGSPGRAQGRQPKGLG